MGKQDQYAVAKKYLAEINHILETERMTIDQREALQRQAARLSGVIRVHGFPFCGRVAS